MMIPFHVMGRRPADGSTHFVVMVNNRELFKHKVPLSRVAAKKIVDALNGSQKAVDHAMKHYPMKDAKA
jgi:hypothetical protein